MRRGEWQCVTCHTPCHAPYSVFSQGELRGEESGRAKKRRTSSGSSVSGDSSHERSISDSRSAGSHSPQSDGRCIATRDCSETCLYSDHRWATKKRETVTLQRSHYWDMTE